MDLPQTQAPGAKHLIFQWLIYIQRNCPRPHSILDSANIYRMSVLMELTILSRRDTNQTILHEYININQTNYDEHYEGKESFLVKHIPENRT